MQNKGNSLIWLIPLIAILTVIIINGVQFVQKQMHEKEWENVKTDMLQIQAKAKIVFEKYHVDEANGLAGEKIEDISSIEQFGIEQDKTYYKWTKETLEQNSLSDIKLDEDYYLINYETEEVIYSKGYKSNDGNTYYKLSEIKSLGEE